MPAQGTGCGHILALTGLKDGVKAIFYQFVARYYHESGLKGPPLREDAELWCKWNRRSFKSSSFSRVLLLDCELDQLLRASDISVSLSEFALGERDKSRGHHFLWRRAIWHQVTRWIVE